MGKVYTSNLSDLLERDPADGALLPVLVQEMEFLGNFVAAATAAPPAREVVSAQRCGMRVGRGRCRGRVRVRWNEVPPEVYWRCPACGSEGVIREWDSSPWDQRRAAAVWAGEEVEPELAEVRSFSLAPEEFDALGKDYFLWEINS